MYAKFKNANKLKLAQRDEPVNTDTQFIGKVNTSIPIAQLLEHLLERVNTQTLLYMLTAQHRLQLLIEILLGHTPLRGGRTRDYPFSDDRLKACELAVSLQARPWGRVALSKAPELGLQSHPGITVSCLDVLVALQVLLIPWIRSHASGNAWEASSPSVDQSIHTVSKEVECSQMIIWLVTVLCADDQSGCETVLSMLGIPWDLQPRESSQKELPVLSVLAPKLAAAALLQDDPSLGIGHITDSSENEVRDLLELACKILNVKPFERALLLDRVICVLGLQSKKVQPLLDKCQRVHVQRGASFWISQNVACVRDLLIEASVTGKWSDLVPSLTVMLDNDAKTVLLSSSNSVCEEIICATVNSGLYQNGRISGRWIAQNFPRLLPYWQSATDQSDDMLGCLPDIELQFLRPISPLELALDGQIDFKNPPKFLEGRHSRSLVSAPESLGSSVENTDESNICSGVDGRTRLSRITVPSWMHFHKGEGYSLAGTAYTLASITYARATSRAISVMLSELVRREVRPLDKQKELADCQQKNAGTPTKLVLLKIDGEQVGLRFMRLNTLRRPGLSITLESLMRDAWLSGLVEILTKNPELDAVPALLVYFGGDDLLFLLGQHHVEVFLEGFDRSLHNAEAHFQDLRFTFACVPIDDERLVEVNHLGHSASAIQLVNKALEDAKEYRRKKTPSANNDPKKSHQWYEGRFLRGLLKWQTSE